MPQPKEKKENAELSVRTLEKFLKELHKVTGVPASDDAMTIPGFD